MAFCWCIGQVYPRFSKLMQSSPPTACSLNYNRDCPPKEGCVISAIKNQTKILEDCHIKNVTSLSCTEALKYVVHFFGDITQPLHCSNKSLGGNQIFVKFDGLRKNLHEVRSSHPRCWCFSVGILRSLSNLSGLLSHHLHFPVGQIPWNRELHLFPRRS
jgi:hypothetical protein